MYLIYLIMNTCKNFPLGAFIRIWPLLLFMIWNSPAWPGEVATATNSPPSLRLTNWSPLARIFEYTVGLLHLPKLKREWNMISSRSSWSKCSFTSADNKEYAVETEHTLQIYNRQNAQPEGLVRSSVALVGGDLRPPAAAGAQDHLLRHGPQGDLRAILQAEGNTNQMLWESCPPRKQNGFEILSKNRSSASHGLILTHRSKPRLASEFGVAGPVAWASVEG